MSIDGLEITEDMSFQNLIWKMQRIGWVIMFVLVLLALLGVFGEGLLTDTTAGSGETGLSIEYPRYARAFSPFSIIIHASPAAIEDGQVALAIQKNYLTNFEIRDIKPEPSRVISTKDEHIYYFNMSGDNFSPDIDITMSSNNFWLIEAGIGIYGGETVNFNQFFYP